MTRAERMARQDELAEQARREWLKQPKQYRDWALRKVQSTVRQLRQKGIIE